MKIIVTRSEPGGSQFAAQLRALGYDAICMPLLKAEATNAMAPDLKGVEGVIVTSAHALDYAPDLHDRPLYAVGPGTAEKAREKGWQNVVAGGGDVQKLTSILPRDKTLLHLAGEDLAQGTQSALAPFKIIRWNVYRSVPTGAQERDLESLLSGSQKIVVTVHSPRAAAILNTYVQAYQGRMQEGTIIFLCLSPAVLICLGNNPEPKGLYAADAPSQEAMVAALKALI